MNKVDLDFEIKLRVLQASELQAQVIKNKDKHGDLFIKNRVVLQNYLLQGGDPNAADYLALKASQDAYDESKAAWARKEEEFNDCIVDRLQPAGLH